MLHLCNFATLWMILTCLLKFSRKVNCLPQLSHGNTLGWSTFWNLPYNFQDILHFRWWFQKCHPFFIWSNEKDPGTEIRIWPFWSNFGIFGPMTAMSIKFDAHQAPEWMPQKLNRNSMWINFFGQITKKWPIFILVLGSFSLDQIKNGWHFWNQHRKWGISWKL